MTKELSQVEMLEIINKQLCDIYVEISNGRVDGGRHDLINVAVDAQTEINRIVWKLNEILFKAEVNNDAT